MILKQYRFEEPLKRYGYDLDDFPFDDAYLNRLLGFLGRDRQSVDLHRFASDHFNLLYGYIQSRKIESEYPSITQETKALSKAQDAAWELAKALKAVRVTGEAGKRFIEDSAALPDPYFSMNGLGLSDLLTGPPHSPHQPLRKLLFDLRVALQRAKIEKPREFRPTYDGSDNSARSRDDRMVRQAAHDDDPEGRYRTRLAAHGLLSNQALGNFAAQLWDIWPKYSDRPFTEGRYEGKGIGNNSATLDFAETCLTAFGAKYRRSLIAAKLRQAREWLSHEVAQ